MTKINIDKLKSMLLSGQTLQQIAVEFGTTKQNVSLWRKYWFPELSRKDYGKGLQKKLLLEQHERKNIKHEDDTSRNKSLFFSRKKQNSKSKKWEFTIKFEDVLWNDVCPVLGISINWDNDIRGEDSPSLDRLDSSKGYIPGNVHVISWRANRIKNDGSADEHRRIADFMEKVNREKKDLVF